LPTSIVGFTIANGVYPATCSWAW